MSEKPTHSQAAKPANRALVAVNVRKAKLVCKIVVTPSGLLAIGGLVSSILLSTAVLVQTATSVPRQRPMAWALKRR